MFNLMGNRSFSLSLLIILTTFGFFSGCAPDKFKKGSGGYFIKQCIFSGDQQYSLQGRWNVPPIKVSFKAGDWSGTETKALQDGANVWNLFFNASKKFSIFSTGDYGSGHLSNANQTVPSCASNTHPDGAVIYKRQSAWGKSPTAIAVTTTCFTTKGDGSLANIFNAILEFNYVNFFLTSKKPDIQSIATHELGHLMGLDHACGPLGRPNQNKPNVACPSVVTDPDNPLISSVMFPVVFFNASGQGEQKRSLSSNDQGRANCLYEE